MPRAAFRLGTELAHPVYDCAYVALADAEKAELATADRELARLMLMGAGRKVIVHWVGDPIPTIR